MSGLPTHARCVVIGCGIVGNSVAYHLFRLGWRDVVLVDKGPLPNPGGSTGHASNFIYLVDHSKEMTALTVESVNQYKEMGVFTESGGIEVARTRERMQELARRMASGASWGIEPVSLVTPAEVKQLVPYIDESIILGGFYTPGVGVVDSLRAGTIMRERAQGAGALQVTAETPRPLPPGGKIDVFLMLRAFLKQTGVDFVEEAATRSTQGGLDRAFYEYMAESPEEGQVLWRSWMVTNHDIVVFLTYACREEDKEAERSAVDAIVASLALS